MPGAFRTDPTPENREDLRKRCLFWAEGVLGEGPYPFTLRHQARATLLQDLDGRLLARPEARWGEWTEAYLGERLPCPFEGTPGGLDGYRLWGFALYIRARTAYCVLSHARLPRHRARAARQLRLFLDWPMQQAVARTRRLHPGQIHALVPQVLADRGLCRRLDRSWVRETPRNFRHAVKYARVAASNTATTLINRQWPELTAVRIEPDPLLVREDPRGIHREVGRDLLDRLFPVAVAAARNLGRQGGLLILPLAMLGGISHRMNPPSPWKDAPSLVRPPLITAFRISLGENFIRDHFASPLHCHMQASGMVKQLLAALAPFDAPARNSALRQADNQRLLGWKLFKHVAEDTARQVCDGVLQATRPVGLCAEPPPDDLVARLEGTLAPTREELVWLAPTLCDRFPTANQWIDFFKNL